MFRLKTLLILTLIIGFQATLASADSISTSKSFKLSVVIPASVSMTADIRHENAAVQAKARESQMVQVQQTVRNNTPVTVQSIVIL